MTSSRAPWFLVLGALLGFLVPIVRVGHSLGQDWKYFDSQTLVVRSIVVHYKRLPIHDPWVLGGADILANPQSRVFSPNVLFDVIGGPYYGNFLYLITYAMLGAFGAYRLLRMHEVSVASSVTGALLWVNSTWFSLHFGEGHLPFGPFLLLPWIAYFGLTLSKPDSVFGLCSLLALFLLDGGMYPFIFSAVLLALFLFTRRIKPIATLKALKGYWVFSLGCVVAFALLAAAKVVPVISVHGKRQPVIDTTSLPLETVTRALFYPAQNITDLLPGGTHRFHEYGIYIGSAAVFISLSLFLSWPLVKKNGVYLVLTAIFFWTATGWGEKYNPWTAFQHVPLINNAHVQSRVFLLFHLLFIIVLCQCIDALRRPSVARAVRLFLIAEGLAVTTAAWSSTFKDYPGPLYPRLIRAASITTTIHDAPKPDLYFDGTRGAKFVYEPAAAESNVHYVGDGAYKGELYATLGKGTLQLVELSPGRVVLDYEASEPLTAEVNTNFIQGWRVRSGDAVTYATATGLVGLDLPAGKQRITLEYWPRYLTRILIAFGAGGALWMALAVHLARRRCTSR